MRFEKAPGRLIKLFITGEDPRSLRTVELDNWSGMAVMGRPTYFKRALEREELSRSCLYLLIESAGIDDIPEVYVGESDDFAQRYVATKFPIAFDNFVVFTNKDENLTRAHVKWLELKVWELLTENEGKVTVANKARPTGSKLPEAEVASMITFLGNVIYVLEALGFEFFSVSGREAPKKSVEEISAVAVPHQRPAGSFVTNTLPKNDGSKAFLDINEDGYLRAGSKISKTTTDSLPANVRKLREQLIQERALVDEGECLRLEKDISFAKPSPASALVKGRSSTGHGDWHRISDRKRLGDVLLNG